MRLYLTTNEYACMCMVRMRVYCMHVYYMYIVYMQACMCILCICVYVCIVQISRQAHMDILTAPLPNYKKVLPLERSWNKIKAQKLVTAWIASYFLQHEIILLIDLLKQASQRCKGSLYVLKWHIHNCLTLNCSSWLRILSINELFLPLGSLRANCRSSMPFTRLPFDK